LPFFELPLPWVGWYEAIEDLIDTLPDSEFAPWQLERLPDNWQSRTFLLGLNANATSGAQIYFDEESPSPTIHVRGGQQNQRGFVGGRVVQMTPRALARFQTFPDWYELPEKKALACRVIGNAVPCLLYQKIVEYVLERLSNVG
jgi:DNA (cytosine-5)-methyltransferase 1